MLTNGGLVSVRGPFVHVNSFGVLMLTFSKVVKNEETAMKIKKWLLNNLLFNRK